MKKHLLPKLAGLLVLTFASAPAVARAAAFPVVDTGQAACYDATPIPQNENFGYFSFADTANPEVFVKVLDFGEADPYLLFTGGLTDFEVHATFTVLRTGQTRTLDKAAGSTTWGIDRTTLSH